TASGVAGCALPGAAAGFAVAGSGAAGGGAVAGRLKRRAAKPALRNRGQKKARQREGMLSGLGLRGGGEPRKDLELFPGPEPGDASALAGGLGDGGLHLAGGGLELVLGQLAEGFTGLEGQADHFLAGGGDTLGIGACDPQAPRPPAAVGVQ